MLVSFQREPKRLLVASCLSCLQGALPSMVMLEGNSPDLPQQRFWAGPAAKPTTTPDSCLCHQASGKTERRVAEWYKRICHVLRSSSSSLIIQS